MPTTVIPLSINFGEQLAAICMSNEDYQKIKEFLFIDGTEQPRMVALGTIIEDGENGGFNLVGLSLVKESAYMRRLKVQHR